MVRCVIVRIISSIPLSKIMSLTSSIPVSCQHLSSEVGILLELLKQQSSLRGQDMPAVQASLRKVISPTFEIVFAGAFSAGKSMLINALLGRELLYSAEGHATGTECYIAYAEAPDERVVLTFLSEAEIREEGQILCDRLQLGSLGNPNDGAAVEKITAACEQILTEEGGEGRSQRAKEAKALSLLLAGFTANRERISSIKNAVYSMEQFNFNNLKEAAGYARRGVNSAVLKKIEYYCCHDLLKDGNVLVDTPGIDAPVKRDAELTYRKIEDPDTSAVIAVLKPASEGDMTTEETELMERMRSNPGIRDRVFYVFNRVDETWYNNQLQQRLEDLIATQFRDTRRVFKTSALLGFYGSQISGTGESDRFGLDSVFADSVKNTGIQEETPQFVQEFNRYCASFGKLPANKFRVSVHSYETPKENYVRILQEYGQDLIDQLTQDSGIEEFSQAISYYLSTEKRPQLFENLANDLQPIAIALCQLYSQQNRELMSQPHEIAGIKSKRLEQLNGDLVRLGEDLYQHLNQEINDIVTNKSPQFEEDFRKMQVKMVSKMDELLNTFSIEDAYSNAVKSHPRNSTAPLLAILVEAFYYLANALEDAMVIEIQQIIHNAFTVLNSRMLHQDYYRELCRLVGNDVGLEETVNNLEIAIQLAIKQVATTECDKYLRESARFYDEGTFSIYQFRQVLNQTSSGYDSDSMVEAEPAIRQLLKLDFEPKVSNTIHKTFRQAINQILKIELLSVATKHREIILQQYSQARSHLETTLEKEAQEQLATTQRQQVELQAQVTAYNNAVRSINSCFQEMRIDRYQLPLVDAVNLVEIISE